MPKSESLLIHFAPPPRDSQEDVVHFAERIAFEQQLAMPEIPPPPPPPPEQYLRAQVREAHTILSRLHASFGHQLPSNVYMAMAYLQIEITNGKGGDHESTAG